MAIASPAAYLGWVDTVVIGYDGSDLGDDALRLGSALAEPDGRLIVAVVDEAEPPEGADGSVARREPLEARFERAASVLHHDEFQRRTATGSVPEALDRIAQADDADAIAVGSTHRGTLGQVSPGSVGERLLSGAPCAVAIAPVGYGQREHPPLARIGVAYDGRAEAEAALDVAAAFARAADAELQLIAVAAVAKPAVASDLSERIESARKRLDGLTVDAVVLEGHIAGALAGQGVELDLLVTGSRGYGPVRRVLLGGVTHDLVRLAPCPVLVVPRASAHGAV